MIKNLYVGNLPFSTTEEDLRVEFSKHGTVVRAQIIMDRETGRSRGFGFVEMSEGADAAITNLNGAIFQGRTLTVNEARPREPRPSGGGGGGPRGGGGFGGGRGPRGPRY
jgi:RNA recognition motif-containing protein